MAQLQTHYPTGVCTAQRHLDDLAELDQQLAALTPADLNAPIRSRSKGVAGGVVLLLLTRVDATRNDGFLLLHNGNHGGRTLQLPAGPPIGRVTVVITPADEVASTGCKLLTKHLDLQAAIPAAKGISEEQFDTALENERACWR
jgi:hypothetical protein